jgi:hypothetical protein
MAVIVGGGVEVGTLGVGGGVDEEIGVPLGVGVAKVVGVLV